MSFRWFGPGVDPIPLAYIRQIPGVEGVVTTLYDLPPGAVWPAERIRALKTETEAAGLRISGIESVNVHDSIKAGLPDRDRYIDAYIRTLERLADAGIDLVCYNFMPIFDWTRSDLAKLRPDGASVFAYDQAVIDRIDPSRMADRMNGGAGGYALPGWEPERMGRIGELFGLYAGIDEEALCANLGYFLKAIMPTCEKRGVRMAIHPDDPAWPVFGLPRIATGEERLRRIVGLADSPCNGVTLCSGSLGSNPANDIPATIRALKGKIHFAHVRNVRHNGPGDFEECAHLSADGSLDLYEIMRALDDIGFDGPIRPDHGRDIWGEKGFPGYGLYDRALGVAYLNGLSEAIAKKKKRYA